MPFLTKSRGDGTYVRNREAFSVLMPHIMNTRTESLVYYPIEMNAENILRYMDKKRAEGIKITFFNIVLAAIARTAMDYPKINRFVAGRRLYEHNVFQAAYVVKRQMRLDGDESLVKVVYSPDDTLFSFSGKMNELRSEIKKGSTQDVDKIVVFLSRLPRMALRLTAFFMEQMEYFDVLPRSFMDSLPFYCSVFASNLGSIGADAPYHHLYERGTCSLFITVGQMFDKLVLNADGSVREVKHVNIRATIDERICDGFYLSRALDRFKELMASPELLETSFNERHNHARHGETMS